ncbi:hypothetical protein [Nannocystis punicea]|uniref:Tetratricopeptide repeat protein n=1 Tax=Nannocystis punicea TaxID=2995304 RepID=A0ABY7GVT3_9BACT|nr:hypothetical protein [Nannocystis poenicansa]WAS90924.1 hypothetical protein O0S08_32445 [Nannocystis poenicansa]
MRRPVEWGIHERARRAIAEGRDPLALWAEARDDSDLETGLAIVAVLLDTADTSGASRVLAELEPLLDGPRRAVAVLLRQQARALRDEPRDVLALAGALDDLLAGARWQEALDAASVLAQEHAGELAAVRRYRAIALGAAEAGGAQWLGATQLRALAGAELAAGEVVRCLTHLEHALRRLEGVPLLGARFEQSRCHELAGDALAAAGDASAAREQYDRAAERLGHPDFGSSHRERIARKRDAMT